MPSCLDAHSTAPVRTIKAASFAPHLVLMIEVPSILTIIWHPLPETQARRAGLGAGACVSRIDPGRRRGSEASCSGARSGKYLKGGTSTRVHVTLCAGGLLAVSPDRRASLPPRPVGAAPGSATMTRPASGSAGQARRRPRHGRGAIKRVFAFAPGACSREQRPGIFARPPIAWPRLRPLPGRIQEGEGSDGQGPGRSGC